MLTYEGSKQRINGLSDLLDGKGQKVIFLNIRSLTKNFCGFEADFKNSDLLAIGLVETWLNVNIRSSILKLQGFSLIRLDRMIDKRGGGILFYVKNEVDYEMLDVTLSISNENIEIMSSIINRKFKKKLCVSLAYIPPKGNVRKALEYLDKIGETVDGKNYEWMIGGDFNTNLNCSNCTSNRRVIQSFAGKFSLTQLIKMPTRVTCNTATLIDHIYANDVSQIAISGIITYGLSDHDIVYVIMKRNLPKKRPVNFHCRTMSKYSRTDLEDILWNLNWNSFYIEKDPNFSWEILYQFYRASLDVVAPMINICKAREFSCWVTTDVIKLIRRRDKLKENLIPNDKKSFDEFKEVRNQVHREVITAKQKYIGNKI